jgi:hypothetical protein
MLDNLALAVVTVIRLDRLARSTRDLLNTVAAITEKKNPVSVRLPAHGPTPQRRTVV